MIVSASYRTDILAFFSDWFRARLAEGHCDVKNPYGGKPYRVALRGDGVDGFVFWTRNAAPFAPALDDVAALDLPFCIQFTVNGYPRALDAHTAGSGEACRQIVALAQKYGPRAVVWRYDPVVFTSLTPPDWHLETLARLARNLAGAVNECVISFAHIYKKTRNRLDLAAKRYEFTWWDPDWAAKKELLARFYEISSENSIKLTVCSQEKALIDGVASAQCVDTARLSDIAGHDIRARTKGNRDGCLCA